MRTSSSKPIPYARAIPSTLAENRGDCIVVVVVTAISRRYKYIQALILLKTNITQAFNIEALSNRVIEQSPMFQPSLRRRRRRWLTAIIHLRDFSSHIMIFIADRQQRPRFTSLSIIITRRREVPYRVRKDSPKKENTPDRGVRLTRRRSMCSSKNKYVLRVAFRVLLRFEKFIWLGRKILREFLQHKQRLHVFC